MGTTFELSGPVSNCLLSSALFSARWSYAQSCSSACKCVIQNTFPHLQVYSITPNFFLQVSQREDILRSRLMFSTEEIAHQIYHRTGHREKSSYDAKTNHFRGLLNPLVQRNRRIIVIERGIESSASMLHVILQPRLSFMLDIPVWDWGRRCLVCRDNRRYVVEMWK